MVRAEIITIGDEILYGQILDTNTQWISFELDKLGLIQLESLPLVILKMK